MASRAALFDMDRTLVRRETASLYVRYQRDIGEATFRDALEVGIWVLQYTIGTIDAPRVAEKVLMKLAGVEEEGFVTRCEGWFRNYVLAHVCAAGREAVRRHREAGDVVAIVTSGTMYAARPLAKEVGIDHVVATELEVREGRFTGKPRYPLCYGEGKITRAQVLARSLGFALEDATFYSDSATDLPLLERVRTPIAVNPDRRLRRIAARRGWAVERW